MKAQQKLDKILEAVCVRVQEEVGSLMGAKFRLAPPVNLLTSKEDYFAEQSVKKIVSKMDITGEIEGAGGLIVGIKDGIRLGGTLIMLPSAELEDVVKSENYTEETEDSYGEIANIIAGSYTKVFEDMYPKSCRFVRKEQVVIAPLKLDMESEEPLPNQWYYWVKSGMTLDGIQMGDLDILIPAQPFGIEIPVDESPDAQEVQEHGKSPEVEIKEKIEQNKPSEIVQGTRKKETSAPNGIDLKKQKKLVDKILSLCKKSVAEEVSALLGVGITLGTIENRMVTKEQFFLEEASGKQVLTHMDVVAEEESESFLFVSVKDAVRVGSTLIMLPPSELETAVTEEDFSPDIEDAYGEIANIISGVYTAVFQDQFGYSIRFVKKTLEIVAPMKVDTDSDEVIPQQHYYMSCSSLEMGEREYGKICMLFPAELLKLQELVEVAELNDGAEKIAGSEKQVDASSEPVSADKPPQDDKQAHEPVEILIIENNGVEARKIQAELQRIGISSKSISFNDNIHFHITSELRLVLIVMQEINEQAYGIAIKVSSISSAPIIAAGSEWTRSKVIKAVKYGVHDILLIPAVQEEIREKIESNILQLAA